MWVVARDPVDRPAPDGLELVRSFVNTRDLDNQADELADADAAARWLEHRGLADRAKRPTARELTRLVEAREAFRTLLVANATDGNAPDEAVAVLNALADRCGMATRLTGAASAATTATTARGIDLALGRMLQTAFDAIAAGTWPRLKACPSPTCHWAYYDRSRNRTSRWCDMGLCGNRAKRDARRVRDLSAESTGRRVSPVT
jgi:predicted RNA-binding Zn ribbon-like protein